MTMRLPALHLILAFACAAPWVRAQAPPLLSSKRISLQLGSAYFFNPWENYNNALAKVTQEIALNRFFIEPVGYYEKVNGDLSAHIGLSYHVPEISPHLFALVNGQYGKQDASFEFYPNPAQIPDFFGSPAFHQEIKFSFWSAGLGVQYRMPLAHKWHLQARAGLDRYAAALDLHWRHSRNARGPVPADGGEQLAAELKDNCWGGQAGFTLAWQGLGPVALLAGVTYRHAEFKSFEGQATYDTSRPQTYTAELVEASNYFGVRVKAQPNPQFDPIFLPPLTFLTVPDENDRVPATVDLSALGLTFGFQVEF